MKHVLFLGPSYHRTCHPSQSDRSHTDIEREDEDDEEEEEEDVRGAPREKALKMKPRKLFKEKEKGISLLPVGHFITDFGPDLKVCQCNKCKFDTTQNILQYYVLTV